MEEKKSEHSYIPKNPKDDRLSALRLSNMSVFSGIPEGRNFLVNDMFPVQHVMTFDKYHFHLGFIEKFNFRTKIRTSTPFFLDMRHVVRALMLGPTGSGKSVLLRRIADMAYGANFYIVFMTDVKDEMKSSKKPQTILKERLASTDIPAAMKVKVFRPIFYNEYFGEDTPSDNEGYQLKYSDLSLNELLSLLNLNRTTSVDHANIVSIYYNEVTSLEDLSKKIEVDQKISKTTREKLRRRIEGLIKYKVCSKDGKGDPVKALQEGFVVVFNHKGFEDVSKGELINIPLVFFSTAMRIIRDAKEKTLEKKRRLLMFIDEAPVFLRLETTKEELMRAVNQWRYLGIYIIFAAQKAEMIPDWILTQSRFVFLSHNIDLQSYILTLKFKQKADFHPSFHRDASDVIRSMKVKPTGEREWLMIDGDVSEETIFFGLPSLSQHLEEM